MMPRFDAVWSYAGKGGTVRDISLTWSERLAEDGSTDARRVAVSLLLPPDLSVPGRVAEGWPLTSMTVSIQVDGVEMLAGALRDPSYGRADEPVEGEIGDLEADDLGVLPPPGGTVTATTFPDAPVESFGTPYPCVWGKPGLLSDGTSIPATPAIVVDATVGAEWLLIAGHEVTATAVVIWGPTYPGAKQLVGINLACEGWIDGSGRSVTMVDASNFGAVGYPSWDETAQYWVSWPHGDAMPGRLDRLAPVLLGLSSLPVDEIAQAGQSATLARWVSAGYVDDAISPTDLLRELGDVLPVGLQRSEDGIFLAYNGLSLEDAPVAHELTAPQGLRRVGAIRYVASVGASSIRIDHSWDASRQAYGAAAVVDADQTLAGTRSARGRPLTLASGYLWDAATAEAAALARLVRDGSRWREVDYACDDDRFGWGGPRELRVGQVATLTDLDAGLLTVRSRVVAIERDRFALRVTFRMRG